MATVEEDEQDKQYAAWQKKHADRGCVDGDEGFLRHSAECEAIQHVETYGPYCTFGVGGKVVHGNFNCPVFKKTSKSAEELYARAVAGDVASRPRPAAAEKKFLATVRSLEEKSPSVTFTSTKETWTGSDTKQAVDYQRRRASNDTLSHRQSEVLFALFDKMTESGLYEVGMPRNDPMLTERGIKAHSARHALEALAKDGTYVSRTTNPRLRVNREAQTRQHRRGRGYYFYRLVIPKMAVG